GHWGKPCFRPDTIPIVILFTDATFHNGPYPGDDYNASYFPAGIPVTWTQTLTALNSRDVRVIVVESCGTAYYCPWTRDDARDLANATGSVERVGSPFVFSISSTGSGLDRTV